MYTKNDKLFCDLSDRAVFVNLDQGLFYAFPVFANVVLRFILSGKTLDETIKAIQDIPGVPDNIADSVKITFNDMIKYELIVESDTPEIIPMIDINKQMVMDMTDEEFDPVIIVSADIQKLLMDDPIHDVSAEGWAPNLQ